MVQSCEDAQKLDEKYNLTTYNETYNCFPTSDKTLWSEHARSIGFQSKFMTKTSEDPHNFIENGYSESVFTNRVFTYMNTKVG